MKQYLFESLPYLCLKISLRQDSLYALPFTLIKFEWSIAGDEAPHSAKRHSRFQIFCAEYSEYGNVLYHRSVVVLWTCACACILCQYNTIGGTRCMYACKLILYIWTSWQWESNWKSCWPSPWRCSLLKPLLTVKRNPLPSSKWQAVSQLVHYSFSVAIPSVSYGCGQHMHNAYQT